MTRLSERRTLWCGFLRDAPSGAPRVLQSAGPRTGSVAGAPVFARCAILLVVIRDALRWVIMRKAWQGLGIAVAVAALGGGIVFALHTITHPLPAPPPPPPPPRPSPGPPPPAPTLTVPLN